MPWALLVGANLKFLPAIPWSVPVTAVYLWFYWRYAKGEGWPRSTADARRASLRANPLPSEVWGSAMLAGVFGLVAVVLLQVVMNRIVRLPHQDVSGLAHVPPLTLMVFLLMSAAVAGVAEESSFRGYMQGPIERRHGVVVAILITGSLFGFAHFTHPEVTAVLLPYYIAVAAVYGALAWLTNSIYPGMVLHAGGNVFSSFDLLARGQSEWQAPAVPAPLVWETGADAGFWTSLVLFVVAAGAAVGAYVALARVVRQAPSAGPAA